ncbi:hypothetical protein H105_04129 [Trichophyton soudanense CBS 452.61]|uniref:F-box domain-containing protein n=1 Tax=Trichophyton soudanense CBS 452.61 TaxID=1215331 RepID=A0A022XUE6_TRISD|nr:hypothetical protein H105_04129 [Trichophyton soudanense CBS 452.61]EZG06528.1 hypothetical protein H106_03924 [Trichophyton rubrum CBS 735.88]
MEFTKFERLIRKFRSLTLRPSYHRRPEDEPNKVGPAESCQYSGFLTLPAELLENIVSFLEPEDLLSLRLTCNACYEQTQLYFAALLTEMKLGFSENSLSKLEAISQDSRFNRRIQSLRMSPDRSSGVLGGGISWERDLEGYLAIPQPAVQRIRDILLSLTNLQSLELTNYTEQYSTEDRIEPFEAIRILTYIIAETGLPLNSLAIVYRSIPVMDDSYMGFEDLEKPGFLSSMSHIQSLSLECDKQSVNLDWLGEIVQAATSLKSLKFVSYSGSEQGLDNRAWDSIDRCAPLEKIILQKAGWPAPEPCIQFLRQYRSTLRTLCLQSSYLETPGWSAVLAELRDNFPVLTNFKVFMLRQPPGDYRYSVDFYNIPEVPGSACLEFTSFTDIIVDQPAPRKYGSELLYCYKRPRHGPIVVGVKYSGPDMKLVLQEMINYVRVTPLFTPRVTRP